MYRGDIPLGSTLDVKFTTVNASGVPTTLAGTPAVAAYVGNGTTEITAGITLSVDLDSRTGLNNVRVVASEANGFADQTHVSLVLTAGTVDGSSVVGYEVGAFSIGMLTGLTAAEIATAVRTELTSELSDIGTINTKLGTPAGATISADIADLPTNAELTTALTAQDGPALPGGEVVTDAGNSATSFVTDRTESTADYWKDALLLITSGVLAGQVKKVTAYNGTTKAVTVENGFTGTPADGVTFVLVNR